MNIVEIRTDKDRITWDRYVLAHPQASSYHQISWRRVIEEAFGHKSFYLMAQDEHGEVCGVLPLVLLASQFFGRFLVSMPFVNYGGLLVDSLQAQGALLQAAVNLAKVLKAGHIELRHQEGLDLRWATKRHKVSMRLELPHCFDMLWNGLGSKLRSQIRRARKEGMSVRFGRLEVLDDFYGVFSKNMRDLGTPVYARAFFEKIVQTFDKDARICAVYLHNRPVAAALLYGFRTMLEIPWASSDRLYNHLAPNMLLYSTVLEYACSEGFQLFDFGRSTPHSGTYLFKEQWGARPIPLEWAYWTDDSKVLPEISPRNPQYALPIRIWKHLPLTVANTLGPFIARTIP